MAKQLSHYDTAGRARMVDVSAKQSTRRTAHASALVEMSPEVIRALPRNPKGDPLEVARIAAIQAAKRTSELIPMCHPVPLAHVDVRLEVGENSVRIHTEATTTAVTGVEMEALVAAGVAALTVYDMCKALDKGIVIREVLLERKTGGKSGDYVRPRSAAFTPTAATAAIAGHSTQAAPGPKPTRSGSRKRSR
jgi:cyclic pyranopterin phosphate synthase